MDVLLVLVQDGHLTFLVIIHLTMSYSCVKEWIHNDGNKVFELTEDDTSISLLPEIHPWYRGFTGNIEKTGDQKYTSWGNIKVEKRLKSC